HSHQNSATRKPPPSKSKATKYEWAESDDEDASMFGGSAVSSDNESKSDQDSDDLEAYLASLAKKKAAASANNRSLSASPTKSSAYLKKPAAAGNNTPAVGRKLSDSILNSMPSTPRTASAQKPLASVVDNASNGSINAKLGKLSDEMDVSKSLLTNHSVGKPKGGTMGDLESDPSGSSDLSVRTPPRQNEIKPRHLSVAKHSPRRKTRDVDSDSSVEEEVSSTSDLNTSEMGSTSTITQPNRAKKSLDSSYLKKTSQILEGLEAGPAVAQIHRSLDEMKSPQPDHRSSLFIGKHSVSAIEKGISDLGIQPPPVPAKIPAALTPTVPQSFNPISTANIPASSISEISEDIDPIETSIAEDIGSTNRSNHGDTSSATSTPSRSKFNDLLTIEDLDVAPATSASVPLRTTRQETPPVVTSQPDTYFPVKQAHPNSFIDANRQVPQPVPTTAPVPPPLQPFAPDHPHPPYSYPQPPIQPPPTHPYWGYMPPQPSPYYYYPHQQSSQPIYSAPPPGFYPPPPPPPQHPMWMGGTNGGSILFANPYLGNRGNAASGCCGHHGCGCGPRRGVSGEAEGRGVETRRRKEGRREEGQSSRLRRERKQREEVVTAVEEDDGDVSSYNAGGSNEEVGSAGVKGVEADDVGLSSRVTTEDVFTESSRDSERRQQPAHAFREGHEFWNSTMSPLMRNFESASGSLMAAYAPSSLAVNAMMQNHLDMIQQYVRMNERILQEEIYHTQEYVTLKSTKDLAQHFTAEDLATAAKVLDTLSKNPTLKRHAKTNELLKSVIASGFKAFYPTQNEKREHVKRQKKSQLDEDHAALEETSIRKLRQVKMVGMIGGSVDLPKPPRIASSSDNDKFIAEDEARIAATIKADGEKLQAAPSFTHVEAEEHEKPEQTLPPPKKLNYARSCHICGGLFREVHAFYDQLCGDCAAFNYAKRFSKADMKGRVCIVTGARVKIGYAIALKLLRMDAAKVIVTTRFPHDAARRFAAEPDADTFKSRLTVYGLDFRDIRMMHHFCAHIRAKETRLDAIINNAAQTVRKPPGFYEHLMSGEGVGMLGPDVLDKVEVVDVFRVGDKYLFGSPDVAASEARRLTASSKKPAAASQLNVVGEEDDHHVELATDGAVAGGDILMATPAQNAVNLGTDFIPSDPGTASSLSINKDGVVVNQAAGMSQVPTLPSDIRDAAQSTQLFPKGLYDRDDQQVDLRTQNSWNLEMGQISTVEMMECHVINSFAPWVLISELKSLMEASGPVDGSTLPEGTFFDKYVVNVSAMEGQFYRNKTIFHPHTNMAKASLNMMTRTASAGFAAVGIFMTAVDTGWITDEQPQHLWEKRAVQPPPLDEWDAAMRVLDPVMCGVRGEEKLWGVFLKNYKPTRW
ncbi:hypothetical protein HDU98_009388, partial [Podochytrium sp. JEL0797]